MVMMAATPAAATRVDNSTSHKENVVVNNYHVLQSKVGTEPSTFRVPRSLSLSLGSDQCCSCIVYPKQAKTVDASAFVPSINTQSVELYCNGMFVHQFSFPNDMILGVKLLALPASVDDANRIEECTLVAGVIVIIASLKKGLVIHTVVLEEKKDSGAFLPIECRQVTTERKSKFAGRRIRSMTATVVSNGKEERTSLLIALNTSPEGQPLVDQNVDVVRFAIPNHMCSIFSQFSSDSSRSKAVPSEKDSVTVKCVGRVKDMTFGSVSSSSGFISLAIMTSTQLTLSQISLSASTLSLVHSANLLLTGCHSSHSAGAASMVVSLGGSVQGVCNTESFAIVYKPKSSDIAFTPALQTTGSTDSPDAFNQEAAAITNKPSSFFSPTMNETNADEDSNDLIQKTIPATMKELRKPHLDESVRIEAEASKVITPERKIQESNEKRAATSTELNALAVDASESVLSPLMGLTLADDGETTRDELTLMMSLLNIQTHVVDGQAATPFGNPSPDCSTHMVIACVEYVGQDNKIKLSPSAMSFPQEMTNLQVMSILPMPETSANDCISTRVHIAFDDLMFSPSPGKLMSPAVEDSPVHFPNKLSIVCRSTDSKQLHCFILATRDNKHFVIESEKCINLDSILSKSCNVPAKILSIKGVALDGMTFSSKGGRVVCCNKIRIVASRTDSVEADTPKPINLSLYDDGTVHILNISCLLPAGENRSNVSLETPAPDKRLVSADENETGTHNALNAILNKLSSFEAQVYRRMDAMEAAIRENTDRIEELETTLLKGYRYDQASF